MKAHEVQVSKIVIRKVSGGTNLEIESGGKVVIQRFAGRVAAKNHAFELATRSGAPVWNIKQGGGIVLCPLASLNVRH